jgi:PLP dependent protein
LLPVSKGLSAARLRLALAAGLSVFGENRVQEAEAKAAELAGVRWQLVGHLQSNKASRAVALFEVIHSIDSLELARRISRLALDTGRGKDLPLYVQVNVDAEPAKQGFTPDQLAGALPTLVELPSIELRGLMTVGRLVDRPPLARPTFARLRELSAQLVAGEPRLGGGLSMGMSADFEVAVEEGATVVRVGSAIFGRRPPLRPA